MRDRICWTTDFFFNIFRCDFHDLFFRGHAVRCVYCSRESLIVFSVIAADDLLLLFSSSQISEWIVSSILILNVFVEFVSIWLMFDSIYDCARIVLIIVLHMCQSRIWCRLESNVVDATSVILIWSTLVKSTSEKKKKNSISAFIWIRFLDETIYGGSREWNFNFGLVKVGHDRGVCAKGSWSCLVSFRQSFHVVSKLLDYVACSLSCLYLRSFPMLFVFDSLASVLLLYPLLLLISVVLRRLVDESFRLCFFVICFWFFDSCGCGECSVLYLAALLLLLIFLIFIKWSREWSQRSRYHCRQWAGYYFTFSRNRRRSQSQFEFINAVILTTGVVKLLWIDLRWLKSVSVIHWSDRVIWSCHFQWSSWIFLRSMIAKFFPCRLLIWSIQTRICSIKRKKSPAASSVHLDSVTRGLENFGVCYHLGL